jgi:hypothetical protein
MQDTEVENQQPNDDADEHQPQPHGLAHEVGSKEFKQDIHRDQGGTQLTIGARYD